MWPEWTKSPQKSKYRFEPKQQKFQPEKIGESTNSCCVCVGDVGVEVTMMLNTVMVGALVWEERKACIALLLPDLEVLPPACARGGPIRSFEWVSGKWWTPFVRSQSWKRHADRARSHAKDENHNDVSDTPNRSQKHQNSKYQIGTDEKLARTAKGNGESSLKRNLASITALLILTCRIWATTSCMHKNFALCLRWYLLSRSQPLSTPALPVPRPNQSLNPGNLCLLLLHPLIQHLLQSCLLHDKECH